MPSAACPPALPHARTTADSVLPRRTRSHALPSQGPPCPAGPHPPVPRRAPPLAPMVPGDRDDDHTRRPDGRRHRGRLRPDAAADAAAGRRHRRGLHRLLRRRPDAAVPPRRQPGERPARPDPRPAALGGARRRGPRLLRRPRRLPRRDDPRHVEQRLGRRHPGRLDHHPAARPQLLQGPQPRPDGPAQDQGDLHRGEARPAPRQGRDPRPVPEHDLLRPADVRGAGGGPRLLRQGRLAAGRVRVRPARRDDPAADVLQDAGRRRRGPRAAVALDVRPRRDGVDGRRPCRSTPGT
jgi:hypothetical protein